ncbi:MAG: cysteine desulfurase [Candidatus Diapherotrites archaeon]|nr:cysteine desulfurase [Candidatus Diapherotrites archaeon]
MNTEKIRKEFPILRRKINGRRLVYLDNTATTQKPASVIEAITEYYEHHNANVHRGIYTLSQEASEKYEEAHEETARFIGAQNGEEIVFTRNATESLNLLAFTLGKELKKGDHVLVTLLEHHSNLVPWQQLKEKGIHLDIARVTPEGLLNERDFEEKLSLKPKLVSFTAASNALGTRLPQKKMIKAARDSGATTIVDGAQAVPHEPVNVQKLGMDFMAFSGHKMLGPTGIGVLYGKKERLESLPPFLTGGDMIDTVTEEKSTWNALPWKFEAGTPNVAGGIGLAAAIKYLNGVGMEAVAEHEQKLLQYATNQLQEIPGIRRYGPSPEHKLGIISFNVNGIHAHDVASVLDQNGVQVRSGNHCAQPLLNALGIKASVRASFYLYNDRPDVDALVDGIRSAQKLFKVTP